MKVLGFWMIVQGLIGLWIFISPFVLGYGTDVRVAPINGLAGTILMGTSLGVSLYDAYQDGFPAEGLHFPRRL